jgi:hypothetical protein
MNGVSNKSIWTGRVLSWAAGLFVFTSGINGILIRSADLREGFTKFGYPESAIPVVGAAALISSLLYLVPRTAYLGAILMTGYLGGAVATHLRVNDPTLVVPVVFGIIVWAGLFLREERLRALIPLRR